jgi:hypothetical protein
MTVYDMTHGQWREWFKSQHGHYPTLLDTARMQEAMKNYEGPIEPYDGPDKPSIWDNWPGGMH